MTLSHNSIRDAQHNTHSYAFGIPNDEPPSIRDDRRKRIRELAYLVSGIVLVILTLSLLL